MDIFTGTRGFIFDCDGTLLDSMPAWNACEAELERLAGATFTEDQLEELRAASITEAARIFHERYGIGRSAEDVLRMEDEMLLDLYRTEVGAKPGARDLLAYAGERSIPCTVVTSSPLRYVRAGLQRNGLTAYLREICTTDELNTSKQEPGIYEHAMATMGSTPETTWGFDDAVYAIRVMESMGIRAIGAYDCNETGAYENLAAAATMIVRSLSELVPAE